VTGHDAYQAYQAVRRARLAVEDAQRAVAAYSDNEFVQQKVAEAVAAARVAETEATVVYYDVAEREVANA
jgi:hypothetical protein